MVRICVYHAGIVGLALLLETVVSERHFVREAPGRVENTLEHLQCSEMDLCCLPILLRYWML